MHFPWAYNKREPILCSINCFLNRVKVQSVKLHNALARSAHAWIYVREPLYFLHKIYKTHASEQTCCTAASFCCSSFSHILSFIYACISFVHKTWPVCCSTWGGREDFYVLFLYVYHIEMYINGKSTAVFYKRELRYGFFLLIPAYKLSHIISLYVLTTLRPQV